MDKWEYLRLTEGEVACDVKPPNLNYGLDAIGADRWELVQVLPKPDEDVYVFKRRVMESAS